MGVSANSVAWEAIFFDVDGVLIDSMDVKGEAFVDTFPEVPDLRDAILRHHLSNGGVNRVQKIAEMYALAFGRVPSPAELDERVRAFASHAEDRVVGAPEMPGTRSALEYWSPRLPLYAVSATPAVELRRILQRREIGGFFRSISGWPPEKSTLIAQILMRDSLQPSQCVLIGDSRQDLAAAERTGLHFVQMARSHQDTIVDGTPVITDLRELSGLLSAHHGEITG